MKRGQTWALKGWMLGALMLIAAQAEAAGWSQPAQSAAGTGLAGNAMLSVADASVLAWNPSAIAWQDGGRFTAVAANLYRNSSVRLAGGVAPNRIPDATDAELFLSWRPHEGNWGFGLSYARNYRADNDWSAAFPGRADLFRLSATRLGLDAVYQPKSSLAVNLGLDLLLAKTTVAQGARVFSARGKPAYGAHASLTWEFAPYWRLGLMATSSTRLSFSSAGSGLKLRLPEQVSLALSRDLADAVRLETDLVWTRWSRVHGISVTGPSAQQHTFALRDTVSAGLSLTWFWHPGVELRAGYRFEPGANRAAGFHPFIADQPGHTIALGAGGRMMGLSLDVGYSYTFHPKRTAQGSFAGTYRDREQALVFSMTSFF